MIRRLTELGAQCLEYPTIKIVPPEDFSPLDAAINRLDAYHWIIFTSVNGVDAFFNRLNQTGKDSRALGHLRTACIGPVTAERLRYYGVNTDILPESFRAESIIEAFAGQTVAGKRMLLPRAAEARPILPEELANMGAIVDEIAAYQTVSDTKNTDALVGQLESGDVDMITFTSSSTVTNFKKLLPPDRFDALIQKIAIASIGPITTETAKKNGFSVHVEAATFTIDGLCDAILAHYNKPGIP
jgi:uroporphyrinogen III methyltransferase/synthase